MDFSFVKLSFILLLKLVLNHLMKKQHEYKFESKNTNANFKEFERGFSSRIDLFQQYYVLTMIDETALRENKN